MAGPWDDDDIINRKPEEGFELEDDSKGAFWLLAIVIIVVAVGALWAFYG